VNQAALIWLHKVVVRNCLGVASEKVLLREYCPECNRLSLKKTPSSDLKLHGACCTLGLEVNPKSNQQQRFWQAANF